MQDRKEREQNEKINNKHFIEETLGQDADFKLQQKLKGIKTKETALKHQEMLRQ